jgi:peptide/nickel transport system substrate-binding protein
MATRPNLANAGAFGFQTPLYEDMGFLKKGAQGAQHTPGSPTDKEEKDK